MKNTKDILKEKAEESFTLKNSILDEKHEQEEVDTSKPTLIVNEKGDKVLVFSDPLHSREKRSVVNYSVFRGKWEFENIDDLDETDKEKCAVKFKPVGDGINFTIAFKSLMDRVEFMDSIYSDKEMKQTGTGIQLEDIVNSKVLKTTGGLIGLSLLGYGLYKFLGRNKEE